MVGTFSCSKTKCQNQTTDFSLLCALGNARRGDTASKCKTIKKYGKRGEEEEKGRGGKKRGHSIN